GGLVVNGRRPSYAQSSLPPFADSWNGVHSFLDFDPSIPWTTDSESLMQTIAWRYDFGFSAGKYLSFLKAGNPSFVDTVYIDAVQTPQTLSWFNTYHPDWVLYQCDRVTPLRAYDYLALIPDFSNPEFVDYKWNTEFLPKVNNALKTFEGVAYDNGLLDNDFVPTGPGVGYGHACGVYDQFGRWVQKFNGR